jgi:hypothetical protein
MYDVTSFSEPEFSGSLREYYIIKICVIFPCNTNTEIRQLFNSLCYFAKKLNFFNNRVQYVVKTGIDLGIIFVTLERVSMRIA